MELFTFPVQLRPLPAVFFLPTRWRRLGLALLLVALLAGCSTLQFAYNHLDLLARWAVSDFIELHTEQRLLFDRRFQTLWDWHRRSQLTLYTRDLRELAGTAARPMTRAQVEDFILRANTHTARLLDEAFADITTLLQSLDDDQVRFLLQRVREEREKADHRYKKKTVEEWRADMQYDMEDALQDWVERLTDEQRARVRAWAQARQATPELWRGVEESWESALEQLLATRKNPGFQQHLADFFNKPELRRGPELDQATRADREQWIALMADLSGMLTHRQRKHFRHELLAIAEDLDELAAAVPELPPVRHDVL